MARKSSKVDGRPAFQLYVKDYLIDPNLGACTLAAQGLWMRMLCMMFQAPERGCLVYSDAHDVIRPVEAVRLARMVGVCVEEIEGLLDELKREGVCSVESERGVIYNRRMRSEAETAAGVSTVRKTAGAKGGRAPRRAVQLLPNEQQLPDRASQQQSAVKAQSYPSVVQMKVQTVRESVPLEPDPDAPTSAELAAFFGSLAKQTPANMEQSGVEMEAKAKQNGSANGIHKHFE